jgi:hypothetical protein
MGKNKAGRQENTANAGYKTALVSGFQKLLIKMLKKIKKFLISMSQKPSLICYIW